MRETAAIAAALVLLLTTPASARPPMKAPTVHPFCVGADGHREPCQIRPPRGWSRLMAEAKARGKWVHVGRVNSLARAFWAHAHGADSIDGTMFSWFSDRWIAWFLERTAYADIGRQAVLEL